MSEADDLARGFGRVAEEYDLWRPGYPAAAIDWIAGKVDGRRAVEIGAGTGKATVELLRAGFTVTALEPDPAMAAVGEARVPGAEWVVASAESWSIGANSFDLLCGAQSWHWVPETTDGRMAESVVAGGAIVWMWNHPHLDTEIGLLGDLYARYMPEHQQSRRVANHRRDTEYWRDRLARVTRSVEVFEVPWARWLTAQEYVALIGTYSDHIALPHDDRTALQEAIRHRLLAQGDSIELSYVTRVYLGTIVA